MTTPVFSKAVLAANVMTKIATLPSNISFGTITLNILNTGLNVANAQIALSTSASPAAADFIDKGSIIPAQGGLLIRNCMLAQPGCNIFVRVDQDDVVANMSGLCQEAIAV